MKFHYTKKKIAFELGPNGELIDIEFTKAGGLMWQVEFLRPTDARTHYDATCNTLFIDALGIISIATWIMARRPGLSAAALGRALADVFSPGDGVLWDAVLKAAVRAGFDLDAAGEDAFFKRRAYEAHPAEFDELRELR